MMTGVILAAGEGMRLRPLTETRPKALVPVTERTCLDFAIDALARAVARVVVVTGYRGDQVREHLQRQCASVPIHTVENRQYRRGNLLSLAAARPILGDEGFILTNVDHLFPAPFFREHFAEIDMVSAAGQKDRPIQADEMKVRVDGSGRLRAMSKRLDRYDGAYIGVTCVPRRWAAQYWSAFDRVHRTADLDWACVEDVLVELVETDACPVVRWVDGVVWFEIDSPQDLEAARRGFCENGG